MPDAEKKVEDRWLLVEPIRVGLLGMEMRNFSREIQMAFDEGVERRVLDRRYELIYEDNAGLPQNTAHGGIEAFHRLCDAGCLAVIGANYTDSATVLTEHANARGVPLVSMCGTDKFRGEYIWGFEKFEGWVGIDQWCPENPRMHKFHQRFVERFGEDPWMWPNAIPGLVYDMAAVVVEGIHRAPVQSGAGVKQGIERIRFMPAVTGGPNTHIAGGPYDHQLFKGDWLHYGRVRGGKLEFAGLFEPTDDY